MLGREGVSASVRRSGAAELLTIIYFLNGKTNIALVTTKEMFRKAYEGDYDVGVFSSGSEISSYSYFSPLP